MAFALQTATQSVVTDRNRACPNCDSHNLKAWALGKLKCGSCEFVFLRSKAVQKKYKPKTRRTRSRSTRAISDRQEKRNARKVKGKQTIASGSTPVDKADVKADVLRAECKSTEKMGFRLTKADLDKIAAQTESGKIPVFIVEWRSGPAPYEQHAVIPMDWLLELLETYRRDCDDQ